MICQLLRVCTSTISDKVTTVQRDTDCDRKESRKEEGGILTTHGGRREDSVPDKRQAQTALHSIPAAGGRH